MSGKSGFRVRLGAALFCCLGMAAAIPAPALAQTYVGATAERPADALARNVRILATQPRDFNALIGAGKAALALGDTQAAAGFFGRAEEVWPQSPQPQIGMGAALAHEGDASPALQYFARAVQLGATPAMVGMERGLAYDLLGYHAQAQADYRAALAGPDAEEARRRLSLSLAITGKKDEALANLAPLMARGDAGAARCRAFVLALTGDRAGARAALEAAMPGSSLRMDYFFVRLPTLASPQKAAAVHLGMFPDTAELATATPTYSTPSYVPAPSAGPTLQPPAARQQPTQPQPRTQVASVPQRRAFSGSTLHNAPAGEVYSSSRVWLQLASGADVDALPDQFRKIKARHRDLFDGISGYVAEESNRARLLIGPFRNAREAGIFAEDLASVRLDAFSWTNPPGQVIRKLSE